jgi:hypothetical protein
MDAEDINNKAKAILARRAIIPSRTGDSEISKALWTNSDIEIGSNTTHTTIKGRRIRQIPFDEIPSRILTRTNILRIKPGNVPIRFVHKLC